MKKLLLLTLLAAGPLLHAQQIPLSGSIGVPGSAPTLCGASVAMPADANYTLTANQYACNSLNVTSTVALTATRNLLAPNTLGQQFTVTNATTGSQSLQVVASTGAAAVVPNGSTCVVNNPAGNGYVLASCTGSGGIPTTPTNALVKINGGNGAASSVTDNGTTVSTTELTQWNGGEFSTVTNTNQSLPESSLFTSRYLITNYNATPATPVTTIADTVNVVNLANMGFNPGTSGTSAVGGAGATGSYTVMNSYGRSIDQGVSIGFNKHGVGDGQSLNINAVSYGGVTTGSDEAIDGIYLHSFQIGSGGNGAGGQITGGTVTSGASTGSTLITTSLTSGSVYNAGGILIDETQGGATATITGTGTVDNALYADLSGITLTPSTAVGNIIPNSCAGNGTGEWQAYVSTTCTVTLISGSFNTSSHAFLSGPFQEEVAVTAVGSAGSTQTVTFSTRFAWDNANGNANGAIMAQGGLGGQAFVATSSISSWPVAYMVIGATSSSQLLYSNCTLGTCNGYGGNIGNVLGAGTPITFYPSAEIIGTNSGTPNQAQLATNHIPFAVNDAVVSTPAAQYNQRGITEFIGQTSPCIFPSEFGCAGLFVGDNGPSYTNAIVGGSNNGTNANYGFAAYAALGAYQYPFFFGYRPITGGTLIRISGVFPSGGSSSGSYYIFQDYPGDGVGSMLSLTPATGLMSYNNGFNAAAFNGVALTTGGSASTYLNAAGGYTTPAGGGGTTTNAVTFNNSGSGAASGSTFNGGTAQTISYNTLGASPLAGSTSLTTLGTVATGTWQGTAIAAQYGGTGEAGTITGLLYGNGAGAHTQATAAQVLAACSGCAPLVSPAFTTPSLGTATATSLLASGIVDGQAPITVTTGTTATLGGTYKSGYTFNEEATASAAVTYTLPTAAAGLQYCVSNAYNGSAANTGTLTIQTSATGQFILFTDGTLSATGGYVISGGAARDSACVVGVDATHWALYTQQGTWTKH